MSNTYICACGNRFVANWTVDANNPRCSERCRQPDEPIRNHGTSTFAEGAAMAGLRHRHDARIIALILRRMDQPISRDGVMTAEDVEVLSDWEPRALEAFTAAGGVAGHDGELEAIDRAAERLTEMEI